MLTISTGKSVPVKQIAERHLIEDLGFIPTVADLVRQIDATPWMRSKQKRVISF